MSEIRTARPEDMAALERLYPAAFPEEDLRPLLRALAPDPALWLGLVAEQDGAVVAHGLFTRCQAEGAGDVALLGPLAVAPEAQRQGLGRGLIEAGAAQLATQGAGWMLVLGDPAYYGRVGFGPERALAPPYALPPEWDGAWQSRRLLPEAVAPRGGLRVPQVWDQRSLWAPEG